jgi:hypothetical protein
VLPCGRSTSALPDVLQNLAESGRTGHVHKGEGLLVMQTPEAAIEDANAAETGRAACGGQPGRGLASHAVRGVLPPALGRSGEAIRALAGMAMPNYERGGRLLAAQEAAIEGPGTTAPRPRGPGNGPLERVTVNLTSRSSQALQIVADLTGDTKTDIINRALQIYAWLQESTANGGSIQVRESADAEPLLLKIF